MSYEIEGYEAQGGLTQESSISLQTDRDLHIPVTTDLGTLF